ncbi:MAG: glycerol-3-phosphate 1-O-acyltransferase PlsY [Clostridia bacterium]|nr:glycerol-3-phosphate 1-O-acyltransferase PlsY [Clostridia bacterium]
MSLNEFFELGFIIKYINTHSTELTENTIVTLFSVGAILCAVIAYLLGSINFAIIISGKTYKQDIRDYGSKNAGMTNMMRVYGKRAAAFTLLGDALKAIVAGLIGYAFLGQLGAYIAGCGCVIGHMFPVFFKFRGGKGVVTAAMSIMMCNPYVFLILVILFVLIVAMTKYISLGSVMCVLIYPFILNGMDTWLSGGCPYVLFALLISVLVIFKHRENIKRLREGTESKFSFKKSVKSGDKNNQDK